MANFRRQTYWLNRTTELDTEPCSIALLHTQQGIRMYYIRIDDPYNVNMHILTFQCLHILEVDLEVAAKLS